MARLGDWIGGARPRTLPASIAPVVAATGLAARLGHLVASRALLAGVVAVALQVGVNYANDYSDGIRGTDHERVGPVRLVGQGLASPRSVRTAALVAFGVAALSGLVLAVETSLWLVVIGGSAVVAAWFYTGGRHPYGYAGLGEAVAFVYFGLVATLGTLWVQARELPSASWEVAVGLGCAISALLAVNNLRDRDGDRRSGKRTLAVRLGSARTRTLVVTLVVLAVAGCTLGVAEGTHGVVPSLVVAAVGALGARRALRPVVAGEEGRALIGSLVATGQLTLLLGVVVAVAFVVRA